MAATHVNHMQKALDQMNLQLPHVISDITGQTGLAIVDEILSGERDPLALAKLRNQRIKASEEVIAKSQCPVAGARRGPPSRLGRKCFPTPDPRPGFPD